MEYKFRGKRVDNGRWVYGDKYTDQVFKAGESCVDVTIIRDDCHEDHEVRPASIGMWTGLGDIHQHDIVLVPWYSEAKRKTCYYKAVVKWLHSGFQCSAVEDVDGETPWDVWLWQDADMPEIVGNTTDNPQLLKE